MNKVSKISHVIFSGGGIKGICYLGVLRYLYIENMVNSIKNVSGSSIGAYFAMILALKVPIETIEEELKNLLKEINDNHVLDITKEKFGKIFNKFGFHSINFMMQPVISFLKNKYNIDDITFLEFVKKTGVNFYVSTTNINTGQNQIFSVESSPDVSVITAVSASMSVPFLFEPILINGEYYVDGVLSCDLPLEMFDKVDKKYILIVILCDLHKNKVYDTNTKFNFFDYSMRISNILLSSLVSQYSKKYINKSKSHVLKIQNVPYDKPFKYIVTGNDIRLELTQEDIDNMILKGFIDMSNYMKNWCSDNIIENV